MDISTLLRSFFFGPGFSKSLVLSSSLLPLSSHNLFPFPFLSLCAAFHASNDASGHGQLPPLPKMWEIIESLTPNTPPTPALHALYEYQCINISKSENKVSNAIPSTTHDSDDSFVFPSLSSSIAAPSGQCASRQPQQCAQRCDLFCFLPATKYSQMGPLVAGIITCYYRWEGGLEL